MWDKKTGDLRQDLMEQSDLSAYINENSDVFTESGVSELLSEMYKRQDISKAELARRAGMSKVYLHQIFAGRRNPSRDRLLCLCIGMGSGLEETQELLKRAGYAQLYPRIKRDAIICHGVLHKKSLGEINDSLFAENEKTLS